MMVEKGEATLARVEGVAGDGEDREVVVGDKV